MRAVLFDMDGVLVRSEETWFRVVEAAGLEFRSRAVSREEFFPTMGQGTAADVMTFGFRCSASDLDAFYVAQFPKFLPKMWVNPEARPLLERLRTRGTELAVVTNTVGALSRVILDSAGLSSFFQTVATADRSARAKPAPDLVELALRELSLRASEAVMVGDSRFDRMAAGAAGVRFIGLKIDGDARVERLGDVPAELGFATVAWRLRSAKASDLPAVFNLLAAHGLPHAGLEARFPASYVVAVDGQKIVGVAGLEQHGDEGLLRSVAVEPSLRKSGIGSALVEERLAEARKLGLVSVSLLTTTSQNYFERMGFVVAERSSASAAMLATPEFAGACPSTAAYLRWSV